MVCSRFLRFCCLFAVQLAWSSASLGAAETADAQEIRKLIRDLAADEYARRETATQQLIHLGEQARPWLVQSAEDPDLEIRTRSARILAVVSKRSYEEAIVAFQRDIDGQLGTTLPGWELARKRLGEGAEARRLFARLYRAEPKVFATYQHEDPGPTGKVFYARVQMHLRSWQSHYAWRHGAGRPSRTTNALALLFIGSDPQTELDVRAVQRFNNLLSNVWPFQQLNSMSDSDHFRRWMGEWILKPSGNVSLDFSNMRMGMTYDIPESVGLAKRLVGNESAHQTHQFYAVLCIGKFGGREHLPLLEGLLDSEVLVQPVQRRGNLKALPTQLRDAALAVLVHLTGQKHAAYGLKQIRENQIYLFQTSTIFFESEVAREQALQRWRTWRSANPATPGQGEPPEPESAASESGAPLPPE